MVKRPVVMVVEDDVEMNELERELLDLFGMDAVAAYSGVEALEVCERCTTDAVLLDLMLPEMDGYETCRRLRMSETNHGRMPIVIVTALDSEDFRRLGFEAGADAYFTKPFDPEQVAQTIQILIDRNHQTQGDPASA